MSVLIHMDMPQACGRCIFRAKINPDENMCRINNHIYEETPTKLARRDDNCPLVEVPEPHGRLIDGDKLKEYWQPDHNRYFDADHFIHTIEFAKTVIPASEVET